MTGFIFVLWVSCGSYYMNDLHKCVTPNYRPEEYIQISEIESYGPYTFYLCKEYGSTDRWTDFQKCEGKPRKGCRISFKKGETRYTKSACPK